MAEVNTRPVFELNDLCGVCQRYGFDSCPFKKETYGDVRWKSLGCTKFNSVLG